jgi:hypothetical protein
MKLIILPIFVSLSSGLAYGQNKIDKDILAVDNYSIRRTGHKNVGFTVDDKILAKVKRHKKTYTKYFFGELQDTTKTIVAHLLLLKMTGDTMSTGERVYLDSLAGRYGFTYTLSGLRFRKYLNGKYEVDFNTVHDVRNRWIEVLGEQ